MAVRFPASGILRQFMGVTGGAQRRCAPSAFEWESPTWSYPVGTASGTCLSMAALLATLWGNGEAFENWCGSTQAARAVWI